MSKGLLQAFQPQPIVELKKQDKSRIETILAYGDRLLVGLSTGNLRIYRINEDAHSIKAGSAGEADNVSSVSEESLVELRREVERFTKRPSQQLAVIKEANVLVSLSDGYVSFHDLQTFELSERLEITKGASAFATISSVVKDDATDMMTIQSHLAVAAKRKILLWSWQEMELNGTPIELALSAPIKTLAWLTRTQIVAGMDPGFVLIDIESRESMDINRPAAAGEVSGEQGTRFGAVNTSGMSYVGMSSWVPKPMMSKLANDEMLLAKDVNTLFIDPDGNTLDKRQIPWAAAPDAIGYSYPYVLCLQPRSNGTLEIRSPDTMSLLQSINLPGVNNLHVPQPNISLAHAGKGFLVSNERCIWRMNAIGYDAQIKDLTERANFDEAISLLGLLEDTLLDDKIGRIREVKVQKARHLFFQQKYAAAMELFTEASAVPQQVISLFPKSIAGDLSNFPEDGPVTRTQGQATSASNSPSKKQKRQSNTPRKKNSAEPETSSMKSAVKASSDSDDVGHPAILEGKDLQIAVSQLLNYLPQIRVEIQRYLNFDGTLKDAPLTHQNTGSNEDPPFARIVPRPLSQEPDWQQALVDTATAVDTTLFRAYMFAQPRLATSLFRLANFCDPEVVENKLYESKRYADLINFLQGKKRHEQALELLQKLGKNDAEDVEPALRGPRRTVEYLRELPFELIGIILRFSRWPLEVDEDMGMQIFVSETINAENLPRGEVLSFLNGIKGRLALRYLEHVIEEWGDTDSDVHEALIHLYLKEFHLAKQQQNDAANDELQSKLETFLQKSTHYDPRHVFHSIPEDDPSFFECRAILHGRLNEHLKALRLYVFALHDPEKAEAYCNAVYAAQHAHKSEKLSDPDSTKSIYTTLLALYLDPPAPEKRDLDSALDLLSRHGSRLPALTTLDFLPPDLSIAKLHAYFQGRMRTANTLARESAVLRSISTVAKSIADIDVHIGEEGYDEKGRRIKGDDVRRGNSRRVELTNERMCAVCHSRLGRAVVRIWPNGEVRHYGCGEGRRLGERASISS
ncbi:MAG: hypothetical protein Q9162_000941 [Coniocarpon cinnabarinum]